MTVFDDIHESEITQSDDLFIVIRDRFPVSNGHSLIIARRLDAVTFFDLTEAEQQKMVRLIQRVKLELDALYSPDGYNIGMNCGISAGQTIMRFHCHVIPRYRGDMEDPRGGVRHCIPGHGNYLAGSRSIDCLNTHIRQGQ